MSTFLIPVLTDEQLAGLTDDELIVHWRNVDFRLAEIKADEMRLRQAVVARKFADHKDEGTETVELGNGYKLKAVFKLNYNLQNEDDAVDKALTKMEKMGPEGQFLAARLVSWKPNLSIKEYRELDKKYKAIIDAVLVTTPGSPSLEFVQPKGPNLKGK